MRVCSVCPSQFSLPGSVLLIVVCSHIAFYAILPACDVPCAHSLLFASRFCEKLVDVNHLVLLIVRLHVCAMDCNPRVQLIHISVPIAIPESKLTLFRGTKMNEPPPPKKKDTKCKNKKRTKNKTSTLAKQLREKNFHEQTPQKSFFLLLKFSPFAEIKLNKPNAKFFSANS